MKHEFKLVSSLEKNFFAKPDHMAETASGSMLKNEIHSFQLIGWAENDTWPRRSDCRVELVSPIARYVKVYEVGYVPSMLPAYYDESCDDYLSKEPGLYPDPLYPLNDRIWEIICNQSRSLWIEVDPRGEVTGTYPITLRIDRKSVV